MIDGAFYKNGQVVLWYKSPVPKYIKMGGVEVVFQCEHGVSLALVDEDKVPPLLSYLGGCCNKKQQMIFLATETQYKHWLDGNGGRN